MRMLGRVAWKSGDVPLELVPVGRIRDNGILASW